MTRTTITFLLLFILPCAFAQNSGEILVDLTSSPAVSPLNQSRNSQITVALPFFEDFSKGLAIPANDMWNSQNVQVNASYGINAKTNGVATFDAIGSNGNLYPNLSIYKSSADTLTSNAINLNFPSDTTVYLTFWYQPQGNGNQPQKQDSLMLEFFDPTNGAWVKV